MRPWRKSTRSAGANCVEVSLPQWRKSPHSNVNGCVEVAFVDDRVAVRNSREPGGAVLLFTPAEWAAFLAGVRDGEFDLERT